MRTFALRKRIDLCVHQNVYSSCGTHTSSCAVRTNGTWQAIPLQAWTGPKGSRRLRLPDFKTIGTWRWQGCQPYASAAFTTPPPPGNIPGTHFCWRLSQLQGHSAAGRIMSMKNFNDTIGNRTRHLPACSAVPQPTAPPRAPQRYVTRIKWRGVIP